MFYSKEIIIFLSSLIQEMFIEFFQYCLGTEDKLVAQTESAASYARTN